MSTWKNTVMVTVLGLTACGTSDRGTDPPPVEAHSSRLPAVAAARAVESAEYRFVFDESPGVVAKVSAKCAGEGDVDSCVAKWRSASVREGMRIVAVDAASARIQSFGEEDGLPKVWLDVLFHVDSVTGGNVVHVHADGAPEGSHGLRGFFTIEIVDARTIALEDERDGREIFRALE